MIRIRSLLSFFARHFLLFRRRGTAIDIHPTAKVALRSLLGPLPAKLTIGEGSIVGARLCADRADAEISIGRHTFIGKSNVVSALRVTIGDDVLISWGCQIVDHDSHALQWGDRARDVREWYEGRKDWSKVPCSQVEIGDKAWLGFNVIVLKGVCIGEGAVVAAGSVVTRNVPPYTLVAGSPAREIRSLHEAR